MTIYDQDEQRELARVRALRIRDPRIDEAIWALCEAFGYGAVMDSVARQWAKKDPMTAQYIGGCLMLMSLEEPVAQTPTNPRP